MKAAMIHFEPVFSHFNQTFGIKKALLHTKKEIKEEKIKIPVYLVPVTEKNPREKAIEKFSSFLIKEGITHIILSNKAYKNNLIRKKMETTFETFTGTEFVKYKLYDILRKYAGSKGINLGISTLIIETDSPEKARQYILKIYKYVKKIIIKSENEAKFSEITKFFLEEYGLFIPVEQKKSQEENEILIQLDSMVEEKKVLNISSDINRSSKIIFGSKKKFKNITKYLDLNQMSLEFLIFQQYNNINEENIKRFCKDYMIKVSKIVNND
ncbi:MAG: hypothetical protein IKW06_06285 [Clostridia bacterium]|nr:hypothetical protein [Clostridia bacterium]